MSFKDKALNMITVHPKLVTLEIGLTITFVIGTAIGLADFNYPSNYAIHDISEQHCIGC